jgi:hypothetical protein
MLASVLVLKLMPPGPVQPTKAVVTGIYPQPHSHGFSPTVSVVARTADGRTGSVSVRAEQISCRIGDTVAAFIQGASLRIDRNSCMKLRSYP